MFGCTATAQVSAGPTGDPEGDALLAEHARRTAEHERTSEQRAFCQNPPWSERDIATAEESAAIPSINPDPTAIFTRFSKWNKRWKEFDQRNCGAKYAKLWHRDAFERVWKLLQVQETQRPLLRKYHEQEHAAATEHQSRLAASEDAALKAAVAKRGLTEVRFGLIEFLQEVRDRGLPMDQVRRIAVQLDDNDGSYKVSQIVGSRGLVIDEDLRLLIQGKKGEFYEGTPLTNLGYLTYRVTGTQSYQSLTGTRQAFVAEPIDDVKVDDSAKFAVAKSLVRGGEISFAQYADGQLAECADARPDNLDAMIKLVSGVVFITNRCPVQFSRPPLATCSTKKGSVFYVYAHPEGFDGFDEGDCNRMQGQWQSPVQSGKMPQSDHR
jgi:hypothetical protein